MSLSWHWRDWPLKAKLLFLTLSTSALGIALVCFSLATLESRNYRNQMASELDTIASILAEQSAAAVLFEDRGQLNNILKSLQRIDTIQLGCIYDTAGNLLSELAQTSNAGSCPDLAMPQRLGFTDDHYQLLAPITVDDDTIGQLFLKCHLEVLDHHIRTFALAALGIGLVILVFVAIVAIRLQRVIAQPILALSDTAGQITQAHDYSLRAPVAGNDELGQLGKVFNEMIGTIESQNRRILNSQRELERTVEERTAELSLANRELEAFSYSVSHDLRQPLRAIDGFSQAMQEDCAGQLDQTARDYLSRVRSAAVRMGHLIDGLLILSRVSRQPLNYETVDISAMTSEICRELVEMNGDPPTRIDIQPDIRVGGDSRLLRIAFQNLLENAWKYSAKKPERRIEITAEPGQHAITISIRDNGAGFDMKYAEKLFTAFNRLHSPAEFAGTGIGLATVYRVIRRHHGNVSADSVLGESATFHVNLPLPA
ncbi:ATP-binding protein [Marinobacter sp. CA1]|uniref:ATP-binding protein n=1 Tax=Marinobacter sp. CA1 TaxID=2817656 RepID=UPI001D065710|nr:ATP-binding protein [Marinobacter sp. CA1]UDL07075.1 HAMP domain-containing protein [Marinobacter sp. CA1]